MMYREILDKYVKSDEECDMRALADMTNDFVHKVAEKMPDMADDFLCKLKMYICPFHDRKTVEKIVQGMSNKDGTKGAHWTYDQVAEVAKKHGIDDVCEFFYVLNMIYSDYYKQGRSTDDYIELAIDFIDDQDGPPEKAKKYLRMTQNV